jgi:hypothetical protein
MREDELKRELVVRAAHALVRHREMGGDYVEYGRAIGIAEVAEQVLGLREFSAVVGQAVAEAGHMPWQPEPRQEWNELVWQAACVRLPALATEGSR